MKLEEFKQEIVADKISAEIEARKKWEAANKIKHGLSLSLLQHISFTQGLEKALELMK